jgi:WD40 repeat protein/tRNA A-37 threonylcarbamoyl transferase component Bud32
LPCVRDVFGAKADMDAFDKSTRNGTRSSAAPISDDPPTWVDVSPADRLERAWERDEQPQLEAFVAALGAISPHELSAMVQVDLEQGWARSQPRRAEEYLSRFASLAADPELVVDVIYAEYLARERAGDRPELAEYESRFPDFAPALAKQIRFHDALTMLDGDLENGEPDGEPVYERAAPLPGSGHPGAMYEIVEKIGSGGTSVVYKARQAALNRFVALKMVRAIDVDNQELLARFRTEARLVASLHHPRIVQVYDYGEHDGLPYLAMELIDGGPLSARLDGTPWQARPAAELMLKLVSAVQFAHERGVVHRDLKPANVLVVADRPELEIKVSDFGLAKFFSDEASSHTKSNACLGTPSYMAPEQAGGRRSDIAPATDIYSLGAILFELLTGRPPYRGESPIDTLRLVMSTDPVSIERLVPRVSRDLATICDKCLRREIGRRYPSAAELGDDLERFLAGKPIRARRIGMAERARQWCRREPVLASAVGCVALLLVGIAAVLLWYSGQLRQQLAKVRLAERSEHAANQLAQCRLWDAYLSEAAARNTSRKLGQRFAALEAIDQAALLFPSSGRDPKHDLELRSAVLTSTALPDMKSHVIGPWPATGYACAMSISSDQYVVAVDDGTMRGFRLSNGEPLWTLECPWRNAMPSVSADGSLVAAVGGQSTTVWRLDGDKPSVVWEQPDARFFTFAPEGAHAAFSHPTKGMQWVDLEDGSTRAIGTGQARSEFAFHAQSGRAAVSGDKGVQVIALDTGEVQCELLDGKAEVRSLAWHPGGDFLAIWRDHEVIALCDLKTGAPALTFSHRGLPLSLNFNEDGSMLASQTLWDQRLLLWDVGTGQLFFDAPGFLGQACSTGDRGELYFLSHQSNDARFSEVTAATCRSLPRALDVPLGYWSHASISPDSRIVAFSSYKGCELWDLHTTRRLLAWALGECLADFDAAGRLVIGSERGVFRLSPQAEAARPAGPPPDVSESLTSSTPAVIMHFGGREQLAGPIVPNSLALNRSGDTLMYQDAEGWTVLDVKSGRKAVRLETKIDARTAAVSHDGQFAAVANWHQGGATIWDVASGRAVADLRIDRHGVIQFSPDGKIFAATPDGVTLWRTSDWQRLYQLHAQGTTPTGLGLAFSPDSRVLAVGQVNGALYLIDPSSARPWAQVSRSDARVATILAFSVDQRWLVTSSADERSPALVWDLTAMRRELSQRQLDLPADVLRAGEGGPPARLEVYLDESASGETLPPAAVPPSSPPEPSAADNSRFGNAP